MKFLDFSSGRHTDGVRQKGKERESRKEKKFLLLAFGERKKEKEKREWGDEKKLRER